MTGGLAGGTALLLPQHLQFPQDRPGAEGEYKRHNQVGHGNKHQQSERPTVAGLGKNHAEHQRRQRRCNKHDKNAKQPNKYTTCSTDLLNVWGSFRCLYSLKATTIIHSIIRIFDRNRSNSIAQRSSVTNGIYGKYRGH